ncbi:MAG: dTDP-4-dehydrorhamnose reductase [Chloroflexi bacterium RBG_16_64_32]|nr:MAG: dTDP-4-dehydrorhamnose reductase [Chloroflexi bacterium RBG_16_64_32]
MRVLVTGGRGQLGRALQKSLAQHQVSLLDLPEMDITKDDVVQRYFNELTPDLVIHAAAWTDTAGCEADPEQALLVNGEGSRIVAEACARSGAAMVYISSNEVFDGEKREPYGEDDPPNPINAYGRSKLAGERHVKSALERHYIVRTAWLYGAGRVSFPEKVLEAATRDGSLKGVTDEVASPTWTADLAAGIAVLAQKAAPGTYHLTNSGHCSRFEWVQEILRMRGLSDLPVEPATLEEFGAPYHKPVFSVLSLDKARRTGIEMPSWQDALARYLRGAD